MRRYESGVGAVCAEEDALELAASIARAARDLAAALPCPRGAPYYGLDLPPLDPQVLDTFCGKGIFRKYQRALMLGCGLGGGARWWAARFGCRVLGVDEQARQVAAARWLSERSGMGNETCFVAASALSLPLHDESFTHVWSIAVPTADGDAARLLDEAYRVLRPAGALALQFAAPERDPEHWASCAAGRGFVSVELRTISTTPPAYMQAARRLLGRSNEAAEGEGERSLVQLFALRPS